MTPEETLSITIDHISDTVVHQLILLSIDMKLDHTNQQQLVHRPILITFANNETDSTNKYELMKKAKQKQEM